MLQSNTTVHTCTHRLPHKSLALETASRRLLLMQFKRLKWERKINGKTEIRWSWWSWSRSYVSHKTICTVQHGSALEVTEAVVLSLRRWGVLSTCINSHHLMHPAMFRQQKRTGLHAPAAWGVGCWQLSDFPPESQLSLCKALVPSASEDLAVLQKWTASHDPQTALALS